MDIAFLVIKQLFIALLFILTFYGLGKIVFNCSKIQFESVFDDFFYSFLAGGTVSILYMALLSVAGLAYKPLFGLLLIGLFGLKYFHAAFKEYIWLVVLFLLLIPVFLLTLYPSTACDATVYHLPIAESIIKNHKLIFDEYLRYPVLPLNGNMLFTLGMVFNTLSAQLISWVFLFILSVGCFSIAEKKYSKIGGFIAFILLISNVLLVKLGGIAYIDIILTSFILAAIVAVFNYFEKSKIHWLYISAIFLGIAAGTKYSALVFVPILAVFFIYKRKWPELAKYLAVFIAFAFPWYLRNLYYTGNPVWPILNYSPFWDSIDYKIQLIDYQIGGISRTFLDFVLIPWHLIHDEIEWVQVVNPLLWIGLFIAIFKIPKKFREWGFITIFSVFTVVWFLSINFARYFIPIVPILTLISAFGFLHLITRLNNEKVKFTLISFLLICGLYNTYNYVYSEAVILGKPPVSIHQRDIYLVRILPEYKSVRFASELDGKSFMLGHQRMYYYGKGKVMVQYVGKARQNEIYDLIEKPDKLHEHLKKLDAAYFIVQIEFLKHDKKWKDLSNAEIIEKLNLGNQFIRIYGDNDAVIYKLK